MSGPKPVGTRSAFGRLFKQSKFSSFDPRIGQVYTTHGGDAHRGNWGFKRPLPIRRRGAYITVKRVDTPEYQTEWNSAEHQALWMKNWDELKLNPHPAKETGFGDEEAKDFVFESDFAPSLQDPSTWRQAYIPNLNTMTREEFKRYLQQIRSYRNNFYENVQSSHANKRIQGMSFYQLSNSQAAAWDDVVAQQISRDSRSRPSHRSIEHMPHRSGGLSYTYYSPLQTFLMTKERKGRLVETFRGRDRNSLFYVASFAGMGGLLSKKDAGVARPMVWDDPDRTGEVMLRPTYAALERVPGVVGEMRQGLKATKLNMKLRVWDGQSHNRSNPHPLGSREYIAAAPLESSLPLFAPATQRKLDEVVAKSKARSNPSTLSILKNIVQEPDGSAH
ncbi:mitochondrial ribosomal protein subunit-domain-containing protein [Phlebopus sp. FC_14]|nr:mitochondrial ribosomal protein subunit-domain-containing protein [Phlebopus sp. FC_14]